MRVSSVWRENLHSGVLLKAPHACEKVLRTFDFSSRFSKNTCILLDFVCISQMCIFHEKIITFFVCNSFTYGQIQLKFLRKTWNTIILLNMYIPMSNDTVPADFFLKTWNFHCTRTSKNWKIHDFFWVFSFVLGLFSMSIIVRRTRFCGF